MANADAPTLRALVAHWRERARVWTEARRTLDAPTFDDKPERRAACTARAQIYTACADALDAALLARLEEPTP